ncbi:MAG: tRNA pseudouridine(38-40) synthase TruA [Bacilli bacterium]|nr:tRNA pseudouridine(38-40) synthase TruA [Bacilli bacterium]
MRIFGVVSYNGRNYQGWQIQPDAPSIQEEIEKQLSKFFNREVSIYGAGRTDAGVHAVGQTFHFDIDEEHVDLDRLLYSLNKMLPKDIKINDLEQVEDDLHARFSAKRKHYSYSIILDDKSVFFYDTTYVCPFKIDVKMLKETLTYFIGIHNFKNFTSKEEDEANFIREIYSIDVHFVDNIITIDFIGNGFMRYMIRLIVGTALEVAKGKLKQSKVKELLNDNSPREIVSYKAPAEGLMLVEVEY